MTQGQKFLYQNLIFKDFHTFFLFSLLSFIASFHPFRHKILRIPAFHLASPVLLIYTPVDSSMTQGRLENPANIPVELFTSESNWYKPKQSLDMETKV